MLQKPQSGQPTSPLQIRTEMLRNTRPERYRNNGMPWKKYEYTDPTQPYAFIFTKRSENDSRRDKSARHTTAYVDGLAPLTTWIHYLLHVFRPTTSFTLLVKKQVTFNAYRLSICLASYFMLSNFHSSKTRYNEHPTAQRAPTCKTEEEMWARGKIFILGSRCSDCEDYILGCEAVQSGISIPPLSSNVLLPSSKQNS
jgi:hypothetical protein